MKEQDKIRAYEAMSPGTGIPEAQKAERIDRKLIKQKYAGRLRARGGSIVGSITIPDGSFWCECGRLRHAPEPCKE